MQFSRFRSPLSFAFSVYFLASHPALGMLPVIKKAKQREWGWKNILQYPMSCLTTSILSKDLSYNCPIQWAVVWVSYLMGCPTIILSNELLCEYPIHGVYPQAFCSMSCPSSIYPWSQCCAAVAGLFCFFATGSGLYSVHCTVYSSYVT